MSTVETPAAPEPTIEQELAKVMETPPSEGKDEPKSEAATGTPESASAPEPPAPPSELEQKLAEIPDTPEVKEEPKPQLSETQQQILAAFPTPEAAKQVVVESGYFQELNGALQKGDFESVEQMFAPEALEGLMEHIYQKHVVNGKWVDRWIQDKEGNPTVNNGLSRLEREIASLKAQLAQKDQAASQETTKAQRANLQKSYHDHLNTVYEKINFSPEDRRWVTADITAAISADPKLLAQYHAGNMAGLNSIIKKTITDYAKRDQVSTQQKQEVIQKQEQKKPLIQGQAASFTQSLPDDVSQVPGDKLDDWMNEKLAKVMRR